MSLATKNTSCDILETSYDRLRQMPKKLEPKNIYTVKEAAKFLGKSARTVLRWCKSGAIEASPIEDFKGRTTYEISHDVVIAISQDLHKGISPKKNTTSPNQIGKNEKAKSEAKKKYENRIIEKAEEIKQKDPGIEETSIDEIASDIDLPEAMRLVKVEDWRKKKRENEIAEKQTVLLEQIENEILTLADSFDVKINDLIERWALRHNIKADNVQVMKVEYNEALQEIFDRAKALAS